MSEYAERIKEVIEKSVLNQRKVADLVGVTETALSNWLNGARGMNLEKITKVCDALEPFTGDCRFYIFTGQRPEDYLKDFDAIDRLGASINERWGKLDFLVHAIGFSDKSELTGRFLNTSRANFKHSLDISAYSLIEVARRAHPLMVEKGGTLLTLIHRHFDSEDARASHARGWGYTLDKLEAWFSNQT